MRLIFLLLVVHIFYFGNAFKNETKKSQNTTVDASKIRFHRQLNSLNRIYYGQFGLTVALHGDGHKFIISRRKRYTCTKEISLKTGLCQGKMQIVENKLEKDFCYSTSKVDDSDRVCLGDGKVALKKDGKKYECTTTDSSPAKLFTAQEFKKICGNHPIKYYYYTKSKFEPNVQPNVSCSGKDTYVCQYTKTT